MKKKMEVGVIGLGKFGLPLAIALEERGHSVVGVDGSENRVRQAQSLLAHVYIADAKDSAVLRQLRFQDLDLVVVSVGSSMEASILIVFNLLEMGVRKLAVKAITPEHKKILTRLGVENVIQPEHDAALTLAHRIANPGMLDMLQLGGGVLLQELEVNNWAGQSLMELQLTAQGIMVVAIRPKGEQDYSFVPAADRVLLQGDTLAAIGKEADILRLVS
ncbi:potassium channel family protein [Desulfovibrio psychrotolerans]|uniref:Potassium uptake protein TrkA n=1 Tax=Desulfovibrio psychrotolerans TaxID=415242 RepID=A0A7J0BTA8_9BACT|nr:TrkA family potassium uptake protein [Desulfovibrio psychrotolerans]GFM36365.1 potassium uptake protein TrkA [Desulfovibrio psychrotolerans]